MEKGKEDVDRSEGQREDKRAVQRVQYSIGLGLKLTLKTIVVSISIYSVLTYVTVQWKGFPASFLFFPLTTLNSSMKLYCCGNRCPCRMFLCLLL